MGFSFSQTSIVIPFLLRIKPKVPSCHFTYLTSRPSFPFVHCTLDSLLAFPFWLGILSPWYVHGFLAHWHAVTAWNSTQWDLPLSTCSKLQFPSLINILLGSFSVFIFFSCSTYYLLIYTLLIYIVCRKNYNFDMKTLCIFKITVPEKL